MNRTTLLLFLIFIVGSCSRELDIDPDNSQSKLVIHPIANVNESIKILLSNTISIKDTNNVKQYSGTAVLFEESQEIQKISFENKNLVAFEKKASENKHYTITCSVNNFLPVECSFKTNNFPVIKAVDTTVIITNGTSNMDINIYIFDDSKDMVFYKLKLNEKTFIAYKNSFETSKTYFNSNSNKILFYNWPYGSDKVYLFEEPKGLLENTSIKNKGFILADEIFFTNETKANNTIQLSLVLKTLSDVIVMDYSNMQLQIEVASINKDYFMGMYSYAKYNTNTLLNMPVYEENIIYSSVKNGYGFPVSNATSIDSSISSKKYKQFFGKSK